MSDTTSSTFSLVGRFDPLAMVRFVEARAHLLRVRVEVLTATAHRIDIHTLGDPDLVGALEAACALAPGGNVVHDFTSTERKVSS